MKLIFASNNQHKLDELKVSLGSSIQVISLAEAGILKEIPEPFDTLRENAATKAKTIHTLTGGEDCFSEDTGLFVDELGGKPGVHSARYAGEPVSAENNTRKLLHEMSGFTDRRARFITVICLTLNGKEYFFEGHCEGRILKAVSGQGGFGYDPVFVPDGSAKSFAEMNGAEKNIFSHRRKAGDLLINFLKAEKVLA